MQKKMKVKKVLKIIKANFKFKKFLEHQEVNWLIKNYYPFLVTKI